jgi:hypothetical protein
VRGARRGAKYISQDSRMDALIERLCKPKKIEFVEAKR